MRLCAAYCLYNQLGRVEVALHASLAVFAVIPATATPSSAVCVPLWNCSTVAVRCCVRAG